MEQYLKSNSQGPTLILAFSRSKCGKCRLFLWFRLLVLEIKLTRRWDGSATRHGSLERGQRFSCPRNDSKFEERRDLAVMAGPPWALPKEPHDPTAFRNQHLQGSPRGKGVRGCLGPGPSGCYLFIRRVSPHTCARIPAAPRSLSLAPAGRGPEGP